MVSHSIVCAIILGLGGKPKILDRGDEITSFIRNKEHARPRRSAESHIDDRACWE